MHFCPVTCQPDALGNIPLWPIRTLPLTPRHAQTCATHCRNCLKRQAEARSPGGSGENDGAMVHSYCKKTHNHLNMKGNCRCSLFYFDKRAKTRTTSCTYRNAELEQGRNNFSVMLTPFVYSWVWKIARPSSMTGCIELSMCMSNHTAAAPDLSGTPPPAWVLYRDHSPKEL